LLPSPELKQLSGRFAICLSGKTSPANCDIRYRQMYWLMVFDGQGELRGACRLGDELGKVMKQGFDVPNAFVEIVEAAIDQPTSLEQLQRNYLSARGSDASYEALKEKLEQLQGVGKMRVARFLVDAKAKTEDPLRSHARGLQVEADACSRQVINYAAFAKLRDGIAEFVATNPQHPAAAELLEPLLQVGLKYSFDVASKCRAYAKLWSSGGTEAGERRADQLLKQADELLAKAREERRGMKPRQYGLLRLQAVCGDAEAVLATLETTKTFGVFRPIHAEWRTEAKAKIATGARK